MTPGGTGVQRWFRSGTRLGVKSVHPHQIERVAARFEHGSRAADGEEVRVDDVEKIARRKPIGRRHDVRLAPADELLAEIGRQRSAMERGREPADRQPRAQRASIRNIKTPRVFNLLVRIRTRIEARRRAAATRPASPRSRVARARRRSTFTVSLTAS